MHMKKNFWWITGTIVSLLLAAFVVFAESSPNKYDDLAQCIDKSGTVFYGAFWCTHCQSQKSLFGSAKQYLPYVECSNPDGQSQTAICIEKGIKSYPTWVFPDGTIQTGEVSLEDLAEKTSCVLPE